MNKIYSLSKSLAVAAFALLAVTACSDGYEYTPDGTTKGMKGQIYFAQNLPSTIEISDGQSEIDIPVSRANKEGEITIGLSAIQAEPAIFNVPDEITFADGETEVVFTVTFPADAFEYDVAHDLEIKLNDETLTTPYGNSNYKASVVLPAPYESIGMGKFADAMIGDENKFYDVEILRNKINPTMYRVVKPYDEMLVDGGYYDEGMVKAGPSEYLEFDITPAGTYRDMNFPTEWVRITTPCNTGVYYDNGQDKGEMQLYPSYVLGSVVTEDVVCEYNKVVEYQDEDGKQIPGMIYMAPVYILDEAGVTYWQTWTTPGMVTILFPGYEMKDLSLSMDYKGIMTTVDGTVSAIADVVAGEDIETLKAVILPAKYTAEEIAEALAAGQIEGIDIEAGSISVPFDVEALEANELRLAVVAMAGTEVQAVVSSVFEYYGGGNNPWQSLGKGIFYDDYISPNFDESGEAMMYEVEILEDSEHPGMYRIISPFTEDVCQITGKASYAPAGSYILVDATDPDGVLIPLQSLNMDWGYGEMGIISYGSYAMMAGGLTKEEAKGKGMLGTNDGKRITFPIYEDEDEYGPFQYQGFLLGDSKIISYVGYNGMMRIVLPDGVSDEEINAARYAANARKFSKSAKSRMKMVDKKTIKKQISRKNISPFRVNPTSL